MGVGIYSAIRSPRGSRVEVGRKGFAHVLWRDGTRGPLCSKFRFRRVIVAHDDGTPVSDRDPVWLVVEWPDDESRPTKFTLTTLSRRIVVGHSDPEEPAIMEGRERPL